MRLLLLTGLTTIALSAHATTPLYCPQSITCQINTKGTVDSCNGIPEGWFVSGTMASTSATFLPGQYSFNFSSAQSYSNASSNCNYVTKSKDTTAELIAILSNENWVATQSVENQWQVGNPETYCYAAGLWYDQINDSTACPFIQK